MTHFASRPEGGLLRVTNDRTGLELGRRVGVARTAWTRLKGLLGRDCLDDGEGLLIYPTQAVHGFFMRFDIDVLHLDREGRVIRLVTPLRRNTPGPVVARGYYALEVPAGTVARTGTEVGDLLTWQSSAGE